MRRLRMSSNFFATSPGVRSSSSAICFCLAGSRMLKHSQLKGAGEGGEGGERVRGEEYGGDGREGGGTGRRR